MKIRLIAACGLILAASALPVAASQKNTEETQVRQAVEHFLHGLKFNDV